MALIYLFLIKERKVIVLFYSSKGASKNTMGEEEFFFERIFFAFEYLLISSHPYHYWKKYSRQSYKPQLSLPLLTVFRTHLVKYIIVVISDLLSAKRNFPDAAISQNSTVL